MATERRGRVATLLLLGIVLSGCGPTGGEPSSTPDSGPIGTAASPGPSDGSVPPPSSGPASGAPSTDPSLAPSTEPTPTPAPTGSLASGFRQGDVLRIAVDRLAVRRAPRRTAGLVHTYSLSGGAYTDDGEVRLGTGDLVSVHLGPIPIGTTVWYLVWPATASAIIDYGEGWYTESPATGTSGPAWIAVSVDDAIYAALQRRPSADELNSSIVTGLGLAGTGGAESPPQPRHDGFQFDWAIASPTDGSCATVVALVPSDPAQAPVIALDTTTTGVKVGARSGTFLSAPWLPIPAGSWTTFTVRVTGTCRWAILLTPLHHD